MKHRDNNDYEEQQRQKAQDLIELEKKITEKKTTLNSITNSISNHSKELEQLEKDYDTLNYYYDDITNQVNILKGQQIEIENNIQQTQNIAKQSAENIYNIAYEKMANCLESEAEKLSQNFSLSKKEYESEYLDLLQSYVKDFSKNIQALKTQEQALKESLSQEKAKADSARLANEREEEKRQANNKYKITLKESDLKEIQLLEEIVPHMRNARPIRKIIWESYFRQPTNDLITRVIGPGTHTGIYKITNLLNGKTYIGQSADISERFKQHIKCGLGIDAPNNKLYTAMQHDKVYNFTFELLEECSRVQLNELETYWIDYYKSQDYGYNMTKGGS